MHAFAQHPRCWAAAIAIGIASLGHPAAAQRVIVQADATVNVGYNQTTRTVFEVDPLADAADVPQNSSSSLFTEIRPGISLQSGSPRVTWRAGYIFAGTLSFDGGTPAYSNQLTGSVVSELTQRTVLTVNTSIAQGGTAFLLSQQPAEAGKPEVRAPGNPNMVSATLSEAIAWQAGRQLQIQHSLTGGVSAPQDDLGSGSTSLTGTVSFERPFERSIVGLELRASASRLSPLSATLGPYTNYSNALLGRLNRDITDRWNGLVTAGVEQTYSDSGNRPLSLLPAGSATLRYAAQRVVGVLDFTHGTQTNLQVGSVSLADQLSARGVVTIDEFKSRVLSFSVGFLHNMPLGEAASQVAAGAGNAIQGDLGFVTALSKNVLLSVRYSVAYQYGQDVTVEKDTDAEQTTGFGPTLAHIFFVGVTGTYSNSNQTKRPLPKLGQRVDGSDGQGFPVVPENEAPTP